MNNNENKKKSEIVYKTVEETIVVTEEDVDVKWIYARKERYHCYRLDIADDKDEWVASQEHDPFYNLCRETTEEEIKRLYYAISQLNEDQQRLIDYVYFKGYSMKAFAEIEGVSPVAITYRHKEILKKLKEIF